MLHIPPIPRALIVLLMMCIGFLLGERYKRYKAKRKPKGKVKL